MHTAASLVCGALVGWLLSVYLHVYDTAHLVLFVSIGMAGASLGAWLLDIVHLLRNRAHAVDSADRIVGAITGAALIFMGFWIAW